MSTDTKHSKVKLSNFGFSGALFLKLADPCMKFGITMTKNILGPLATMASPFTIIGAFQRKLCGRAVIATRRSVVARIRKGITLVISNEYMDDAFRVVKSLKSSGEEIDRVCETVKQKIEKQKDGFLGMLLATSDAPMLVKMLTVKGVTRAVKGAVRVKRGFDNMDKNV